MKFGMPTMVELPDLQANAELCCNLGLDFVEINMNLPMYQVEGLGIAEELSQRYGVGFTIHLDENFAPADFNPFIAQAHLETLRQTIRAARGIHAPTINMHLTRGVYFKLPDRTLFLYDRYREQYMAGMRRVRDICEAEIGGSDIRICIENTNGYLDYQKDAAEMLLESPVFGLTWDVGHSHTAPIDDKSFLQAHRQRISHIHIHDAIEKRDHLALGSGNVELANYISLAEACRARCVVETKTVAALESSVHWLWAQGFMKLVEK